MLNFHCDPSVHIIHIKRTAVAPYTAYTGQTENTCQTEPFMYDVNTAEIRMISTFQNLWISPVVALYG